MYPSLPGVIDDCGRFRAAIGLSLHGFCSAHLSRQFARYRNLPTMSPHLYHAGFRGKGLTQHFSRRERTARLAYGDFAHVCIAHARSSMPDAFATSIWIYAAYAFDSTTIDLCLSLFPWAKFRKRREP
jgi:hypothetical protein